jgi:outer membrane lipoprotein SlyB
VKALSKLQGSIIVQAAADDSVVAKFNSRARMYVTFGALVLAAIAAQPAHAQNQVLTPSNCAAAGAAIGGAAGAMSSNNGNKQMMVGILGALGGGAAGAWLCSPKTISRDQSYEMATTFGGANPNLGMVDKSTPKMALSISEQERLDALSAEALGAKVEWKRALWSIRNAEEANNRLARNTAVESESVARQNFEQKRAAFATVVARYNAGSENSPPRAVNRYIEISASMLELDTKSRTSYDMLAAKDQSLIERNPAYGQETLRSAKLHKTI